LLKHVANYAADGSRNCADDHEEMAPEMPEYDSSRGQMDKEQYQKVIFKLFPFGRLL